MLFLNMVCLTVALEDEGKMEGVVDPHVYWTYLCYTGRATGVFLILATILMYLFHLSMDLWLTHWITNRNFPCQTLKIRKVSIVVMGS
jgi:hypothetical protein